MRVKAASILFLVTFAAMLFACTGGTSDKSESERDVLVVLSYSEHTEYISQVMPLYEEAFRGQNVHLRTLNSGVPDVDYWQSVLHFVGKMKQWNREDSLPDLVILHGDEAVDRYLAAFQNDDWKEEDNVWKKVPVVYTGVVCMDTISRTGRDSDILMTGFHDSIDWKSNLRLAKRLWPAKPVVTELDFYPRDSLMKLMLKHTIAHNKEFIDNSEHRLPLQGVDTLRHPQYSGRQLVNIVSLREKHTNLPDVPLIPVMTPELHRASDSIAYVMLHNAKYMAPLQTKLDIHSNTLLDYSQMPQLSCVNVQFGDKKVLRILGGYFVSLETQVKDAAGYALRVLDGEKVSDLPKQQSRTRLYMDWRAMEVCGLEYSDWKDDATIINIPFRVSHPLLWMLAILGGVLALGFVVSSLISLAMYWIGNSRAMRRIRSQHDQMEWILKGNRCAVWRVTPTEVIFEAGKVFRTSFQTLSHEQFLNCFHPDDRSLLKPMLSLEDTEGRHSQYVRYTADGDHPLWLELAYMVTTKNLQQKELQVMAMNVDQQKRDEESMLLSLQKSEETDLKQSFLANLSHDIRSPLASIVSMAEMLAEDSGLMTEDERRQFSGLIQQNSDIMLNLLDDVSNTRRIQIGEYRFMRKEVSVADIMHNVYQAYQMLVPQHLTFELEEGEDCKVYVDQARVQQVLNNFLSNAIKATRTGGITMGWLVREREVELFVRDTGCGIAEEVLPRLFDKYFKADGQNEGAGLGLSICQTMVEKQEGRIAVDSHLGKGSTFSAIFQRLTVLLVAAMAFLATACQKESLQGKDDGTPFHVTVIHSYDSLQYVYKEFDQAIGRSFANNGLDVSLRHVYLDNDDYKYHSHVEPIISRLMSARDIDLLICEGDPALERIMEYATEHISRQAGGIELPIPVVAGNINAPRWTAIKRFRNLLVWTAGVDPRTILPFIGRVTGKNMVEVEIDHDVYNQGIRRQLITLLQGVPYMDQLDMSDMRALMPANQRTIFADSMIVLGVSLANPEYNGVNDPAMLDEQYSGQHEELTNILLNYSVNYPQLVVKNDLWSRGLAMRTHRPQFTLVPYDFGSINTPYLAGYFASMSTVAADIASTATYLLRGDVVSARFCGRHQREMFMDYNALKSYSLNYDDMKGQWVMVNVPLRLRQPIFFYGVPSVLMLMLVALCYWLVVRYYKRHYHNAMRLHRSIGEGRLSLMGTELYFIHADVQGRLRIVEQQGARRVKEYASIRELVETEHQRKAETFIRNLRRPGYYNLELPLTFNHGKNYHWWRLTYVVEEPQPGLPCEANGVLINVDTRVERERKMAETKERIQEMERKEKFLNNLNHEMRTPLNIIMGFSEILASPDLDISPEERALFRRSIRYYSNRLLAEVQDILDYSRLESGRMKYQIQPTSVEGMMVPLMEEIKYKVEHPEPSVEDGTVPEVKVKVVMHHGRSGFIVMADMQCVKRILEQLVSNALKFTQTGEIHIGWTVDMQGCRVEFYVEDTGIGMTRETQKLIFRDFYKQDKMDEGIGLGLSICRAMTMGMGGHMAVNSAPGMGSRLSFFLKMGGVNADSTDIE